MLSKTTLSRKPVDVINGFGKNSGVADTGQCGGSSGMLCIWVLFCGCILKTARPTTFFEEANTIHTLAS